MNESENFKKLKEFIEKDSYYTRVMYLLYWDFETQMPKKAFDIESKTLDYFSTEQFKLETSEELKQLIDAMNEPAEYDALDDVWKFTVRRMKRDYDKMSRVPVEFHSKLTAARMSSKAVWIEAKKNNDFKSFAPHLEEMIELTRQLQAYTNPDREIYDSLLNEYEEGVLSDTIDRVFGELKEGLLPLVKQILAAPEPDSSKFKKEYSIDAERELEQFLLSYIGFDREKGNVGESEHPFTDGCGSVDVRITNHFHTDDAIDPIFSAIHEGGHAIFAQNVNPDYDYTAAGDISYLGLHESQSRFYENILGRNINFWKPIYSRVCGIVPQFKDITLEEFSRELNHIRPSMIRTSADELTYCFHIILRYEMEKAIFRDNVPVSELPALWNSKMQEYLGITPANDAEGILQDTHWADGSFGYFPSYLLGNIYDGMFLEQLEKELGSVDSLLADGKILDITHWLNEKIHRFGNTRLPAEVIREVCGREMSAEPILRYFREKYTKLYGLKEEK